MTCLITLLFNQSCCWQMLYHFP